jgi:hypothetical protein
MTTKLTGKVALITGASAGIGQACARALAQECARRSPWAQTYYQQQRSRGKSHACAIRALGQRWLKILWKMWLSNSPYNPDFHTKNQLELGSWVLKLLTQSPNSLSQ